MARQGRDIDLTILYGAHREDYAEDWGDPKKGWFEQQVARSQAYAFEMCGWKRTPWINSLGRYAVTKQVPPLPALYRRAWLAVAQHPSTYSFAHDVEHTSRDLDQVIMKMTDFWRTGKVKLPKIDQLDWSIIQSTLRENYMVGKFGYEMRQQWRSFGRAPVSALMTVGSLHGHMTDRFRQLGVHVSPKSVGRLTDEMHRMYPGIMQTGVIPRKVRT